MCILVVALGCHPALPFLCAHNRDEDRDRPWSDDGLEHETRLICGRDVRAGGTVLALHAEAGHFCALTNSRSHVKRAGATSRGLLVEHLAGLGPDAADGFLHRHLGDMDGFHALFGDIFGDAPRLRYVWNAPVDGGAERGAAATVPWHHGACEVPRGRVFVISNENPAAEPGECWPKSEWLRQEVAAFISSLPASPAIDDVHAGLASIMTRFDVPSLSPPARFPKWFEDPEQEASQHRGPFAPWRPLHGDFGTVSQRVLLSDGGARRVHYFYRSTNVGWEAAAGGAPAVLAGPWRRLAVPWGPREAEPPVLGAGPPVASRSRL